MKRRGWCVVTCRQPSILTISCTTTEPGRGSGSRWRFLFFFFFFLFFLPGRVAWELADSCSSTGYPITTAAPRPPLPQTCASGSSTEALFQLHPSLYYSTCTLKASKRAPGRPGTGNRCMRSTILSPRLGLPHRRRSLFPVNLHMESG